MYFLTSCDANYMKYLKVLMASVYANHPDEEELIFYVLYHDLSDQQMEEVGAFSEQWGQGVHFVWVDEEKYQLILEKFSSLRWPTENMYAMFAHELLPDTIDRVLALDIDIAVNGDLTEFYWQDFEDCYLIASPEHCRADREPKEDFAEFFRITEESFEKETAVKGAYFNAGVLLLNLQKFRRDGIDTRFYLKTIEGIPPESIFFDQGILNLAFARDAKLLTTSRYNYRISYSALNYYDRDNNRYHAHRQYQFVAVENIKIYHYTGWIGTKPWEYCFSARDIPSCEGAFLWQIPECVQYYGIWWKYAELTPDFNQLWQEQMMNKAAYKQIKKIILDRPIDFANQAGIENLYAPVWRNVNSIDLHSDLNQYIKPRVYRCVSAAIKKTLKNLPEEFVQACGFRLTVKHISFEDATVGENTSLLQILEPNDPKASAYRRYCGSPGRNTWGEWYKLATTEDVRAAYAESGVREGLVRLEKRIAGMEEDRILAEERNESISGELERRLISLEAGCQTEALLCRLERLESELQETQEYIERLREDVTCRTEYLSTLEEENRRLKASFVYRVGRLFMGVYRRAREILTGRRFRT